VISIEFARPVGEAMPRSMSARKSASTAAGVAASPNASVVNAKRAFGRPRTIEPVGSGAPVVMLTAYAQTDLMNQAASAGVFGYLIKPLRQSDLVPALLMAQTRWTQFQGLSEEIVALKARKRVSDVTEQAKVLLIEQGLNEEQAFSLLRKAAMNGRITIAEAATQVISGVTGRH